MSPHGGIGRRGFTTSEPWIPLTIVVILAIVAFVILRRIGRESHVRTAVLHSLAMLADSQEAYRRRTGRFAGHLDSVAGPGAIALRPDSGALITITHADSLGWAAIAAHPALRGKPRTCYIYGGGTAPHDQRLTRPGEPKCW